MKKLLSILVLLMIACVAVARTPYKVMFWNVENLFDTIADPSIDDREFTHDGPKKWNGARYQKKMGNIERVVSDIAAEEDDFPIVIGVSEIENRKVLSDIASQPKLAPAGYAISHFDSPEGRGVDAAFLYRPDVFKLEGAAAVRSEVPSIPNFKTRDISTMWGTIDGEPFYFMVVHWPSRRGGKAPSEFKRVAVGEQMRRLKDSVMRVNPATKVIAMGDFNDDPTDPSMVEALGALPRIDRLSKGDFFNPFYSMFRAGQGSLAYQDGWNLFDNIVVSENLATGSTGELRLVKDQKYYGHIFKRTYMYQKEGQFKGYPLRTYVGNAFMGGYSDHAPVYISVGDKNSRVERNTRDDAALLPTSLGASRDPFTNIASYRFSEMRFNMRGYRSENQDIYLNGIRFNDALTGYGPWSLWSGLNDATRNQNSTTGLEMSDFGIGGIAGVQNINARASQLRQGTSVSFVNAEQASYRFRVMATYASGMQDNGWAYALSVSTRQGGNDYVEGLWYNAFGYFLSAEKQFDARHRLGLTFMATPGQRGAQQASTQEVYDLVGSNYYNPNMGIQDGKYRNSRVRNVHEPIAMATYTFDVSERTRFEAATSFRFGQNGYSALTWYGGPDPRPDYYRNLPSYYRTNANTEAADTSAEALAERWRNNTDNIRYFDFDEMIQANRGWGGRSNYMIEERHTDQLDWNLATRLEQQIASNQRLLGGVDVRVNKTAYYSEVKDLLGGEYWLDVDKFAERDFGSVGMEQYNDLDYYKKYGHARQVTEGDKYGYYYNAHVRQANLWAQWHGRFGRLDAAAGGQLGATMLWREGMWRKGLFPTDSKGDSEHLKYLTYRAKVNLDYRIDINHKIGLNGIAMADAPTFRTAFISPRTRNSVTPYLKSEKTLGGELSYEMRYGEFRLRASGFYTQTRDGANVISFYDDLLSTFTNFAMSEIDKRYMGFELGFEVPVWNGIFVRGALTMGDYTYTSNPFYEEIADNSATPLSSGRVYWEGFEIEGSPSTAANLGIAYRGPNRLFVELNANFYDGAYLSMNPMRRTDNLWIEGMTDEEMLALRREESLGSAFTMSASVGKSWTLFGKYTLGGSLEIRNLLNNRNVRTGGYEQMRAQWIGEKRAEAVSYEAFDSKYFYMTGLGYYMNIYFRF